MKIGIPKETKNNEFRVALVPDDVKKLIEFGHKVFVERGAGRGTGFSDAAYKRSGAKIRDDVYNCEMIVRVKSPPISTIRENQIIFAYHHVEKGQNPALLNALLAKNVTAYAYEEIRDSEYERRVNLGWEAGVVGMYRGLRTYIEQNKIRCSLPSAWKCRDAKNIFRNARRFRKKDIKVAIIGNGKVAAGCIEVLKNAGIAPLMLDRSKSAFIEKYLPELDIVVNAVIWYPYEPQIIRRDMLKIMKKNSVIVDISCDEEGAVETCIPTTWEEPSYKVEGVTHVCIDNLPSAIPVTASKHLSTMIIAYVLAAANKEKMNAGMMTQNGVFVYEKRTDSKIQLYTDAVHEEEIVIEE